MSYSTFSYKIEKNLVQRTRFKSVVLKVGIEPTRPERSKDFKSSASTYSATRAKSHGAIITTISTLYKGKKSHFAFFFILSLILSASVYSREAIPLANHSIWSEKGLVGSFALGPWFPSNCQNLTQWRGRIQYLYSPKISGQLEVHIKGGTIQSDQVVVSNRYVMGSTFYQKFFKGILYENISVAIDKSQITQIKPNESLNTSDDLPVGCEEIGQDRGFTPGIEFGYAHKLFGSLYWNTSSNLDIDLYGHLKKESSIGLAFDLKPIRDSNTQTQTAGLFLYSDFYWIMKSEEKNNIHLNLNRIDFLFLVGVGVLF
jgi:hypothetical protein